MNDFVTENDCPDGDCGGLEAISAGKLCQFNPNKAYKCGQYAVWDGVLVQSKVNQSPDPAAEADQSVEWVDLKSPDSEQQWAEIGDITGLLDILAKDKTHAAMEYPFYPECKSHPLCSCKVPAGACMLDLVPVLDDDGNEVIDECAGKVKMEVRLFFALGDAGDGTGISTSPPYEGSQDDPKSWDGGNADIEGFDGRGYLPCMLHKMPVAQTLNGEIIKPTGGELPCLLGCGEVAAELPLTIEDAVVGGKEVKLWKLLYAKGLGVVGGKLQVAIDTAKGLYFEGDKIAVAIGKALGFAADGKIDVQVDGATVWVNSDNKLTACVFGVLDSASMVFEEETKDTPERSDWIDKCHTLAEVGAPEHATAVTLFVHLLAAQHTENSREDERTRMEFRTQDGGIITRANAGSDAQSTKDNPDETNAFQITLPVVNGQVCYQYRRTLHTKLPGAVVYPPPTGVSAARTQIRVWPTAWNAGSCPN